MARNTASTRQPPAGGPGDASGQDGLLRHLRRGERDAFVRYFGLYRTPVYGLALRLLRDEEAAATATAEALSAAFRRVILDDGASDLETLTYRCAFDSCAAHDGAAASAALAAGSAAEAVEPAGTHRRSPANDTTDRFEASLDTLELQQRAALLLHDVQGLGAAQLAVVFATSEEAAAALLFRARVEFRGAFHARSAHVRGGACRQAEQTVAGTVGLGLSPGELERLRSHAAYCKPCRKAMQGWRPGAFGLTLVLHQAPPPKALAAPPVFGAAGVALAASSAAGAGWLARTLRPAGRVLRSRLAAYVVAAACLALAAGVVLREDTVRRFVLFESVGPAVQLVRAPDAGAAGLGSSRDGVQTSTRSSSSATRTAIGAQTGSQPQQTAAAASVPAATGGEAPPATETTDDEGPPATETTDDEAPPAATDTTGDAASSPAETTDGEAPSASGTPEAVAASGEPPWDAGTAVESNAVSSEKRHQADHRSHRRGAKAEGHRAHAGAEQGSSGRRSSSHRASSGHSSASHGDPDRNRAREADGGHRSREADGGHEVP